MIHAWDAEEDDWWYDILPKLRLNCPLRIELFGAFDIMAMDVHASARTLSLDGFIGPITPGASIGVKGESGGGTLGGILRFKLADGSTAQVGLTNHRVVQETQLAKGKNYHIWFLWAGLVKNMLIATVVISAETANGRPLNPKCSLVTNASVEVMSPCDTDKVTRLEVIDNIIADSKKMVFGDGSQIGLQDQVSFGQTSKATALQRNIDDIAQGENEKSQINSADRRLGHVVASSGIRTAIKNGYEWAIDWALVELTSNRPTTNTILGAIGGSTRMFRWESDTVDEWAANGMTPGHIVSKKGRTTAWTDGEVSAIDTILHIMRRENGVDINPYGRPVTASPVTPVPGTGGNFCVSGDSGSLVIKTSDKKIVGLLFAGREQIGLGYVTPFDIIMEDIKNVTGWDIINPTKA